jgi:acetylornithine aminotransferase/acetylornithine/N-succinyldiaminopimelate aminotransferase
MTQKPVRKQDGTSISLCDLLQPGSHGTTFGGTPLACAVALAVLETIDKEGLLKNAGEVGAFAVRKLRALTGLKEVRGRGLMLGLELSDKFKELTNGGQPAQIVVKALMRNGLLAVPAGPLVIRWLPPLNVGRTEMDEAISILAKTLAELST